MRHRLAAAVVLFAALVSSALARADGPAPASAPASTAVRFELSADAPDVALQRRGGTVEIAVRSSSGETATGAGESWQDVCVAPCSATVPPNQTLRVAGDGVTPSESFVLRGDQRLEARTGSLAVRRAGAALASIGILAAVTGGVLLALDVTRTAGTDHVFDPTLTVGLLAGGGIAFVGGVTMLMLSGTVVKREPLRLADVAGGFRF